MEPVLRCLYCRTQTSIPAHDQDGLHARQRSLAQTGESLPDDLAIKCPVCGGASFMVMVKAWRVA